MAKPSIFSSDYEKRMRKRRARKIFAAIFIIGALTFIAFLNFGNLDGFNNKLRSLNIKMYFNEKFKQREEAERMEQEKQEVKEPVKEPVVDNTTVVIPEKDYNFKLDSENNIKVIYDDSNEEKKIKEVAADKEIYYNISISSEKVVALSKKSNKMYLVDAEGNLSDITKENYVSSAGTVFTREEQLKIKPDYIWCQDPKFISEDSIVYISQLPWFNKEAKYIWLYNISSNTHFQLYQGEVQSLKFDRLTDKGLRIEMDGTVKFITDEGKIID